MKEFTTKKLTGEGAVRVSCCQGHETSGKPSGAPAYIWEVVFFSISVELVTSCAGRLHSSANLSSDDKESVAEVGNAFESFPYVSLRCASLDVLSASGYPCVVALSVSCCQTSPISVTCVVRSEYRTFLVSVIISVTRKGEDFCPSADRWVMAVSFPVCRNSPSTWPDFVSRFLGIVWRFMSPKTRRLRSLHNYCFGLCMRWHGKPSCIWLQYCSNLPPARAHVPLFYLVWTPTVSCTSLRV